MGTLLRAHLLLLVPLALATGFSMLFAPQSQLVLRLVCREHYSAHNDTTAAVVGMDPPMAYCQLPAVQRQIATTSTLISLCSTIPNTLVGPILGKLSDNPRIGRKPILALPILAELANILAYIAVFTYALPAWTLALGALIMGLSGSLGTFLMAFFALATDQIEPQFRSYFFSIADGALFVGMTIGPAVMAAVTHALPDEPRAIFLVAAGVFVITFVVTVMVVQEKPRPNDPISVPPPHEHEPEQHRAGSRFAEFMDSIRPLWHPWSRSRMVLFATMALANLALTAHFVAFVPYTFRRYDWTAKENGYFQSISFACKVLAVAVFLPVAYRRHAARKPATTAAAVPTPAPENDQPTPASASSFRHESDAEESTPLLPSPSPSSSMPAATTASPASLEDPVSTKAARTDLMTIRLALLSYALTFLLFSQAPTGAWFLAAAPVDAVGILALPLQRALLTHTATPHTQGLVLGAAAAISGLAGVVGPLVFTGVYAWSVGTWDGLVYVVGAGVWVVAAGLVGWIRPEEVAHRVVEDEVEETPREGLVSSVEQQGLHKSDQERQGLVLIVEDEE